MKNYHHFKQVLQHSSSFYMISTSVDGLYQYVNPAYQNRFSHVSDQLVGKPFHITLHPDDIQLIEAAANKCFAEPEKTFPATLRKHNGEEGYVVTQWDFKLMRDDENQFAGFFCVGYDITEFENEKTKAKKLKTALTVANDNLEYKTELLEELVFDQSHLLRSPLSNILGIVNILQKMEVDENVKNLVNMLGESSNSLDKVVKRIVNKVYQ